MKFAAIAMIVSALAVAGCSGGAGVSTGSILGDGSGSQTAQVAAPTSDPTSRALLVGAVSARAAKCGYNFDPVRLKAKYFASEASLGASGDVMANLDKVYAVAYGGVSKAAAGEPDYCSEGKTKEIKADLTRVLAGDYNPPAKAPVKDQGGGFFSGLFGDAGSAEKGPAFGTSDWWAKQESSAGGH